MDYKLLGKRIRELRQRMKLTQQQLAEKVEISTNFMGQIERAEGILSLATLVNIANILQIDINYLLQDCLNTKQEDDINSRLLFQISLLSDIDKIFISNIIDNLKVYKKEML